MPRHPASLTPGRYPPTPPPAPTAKPDRVLRPANDNARPVAVRLRLPALALGLLLAAWSVLRLVFD